MTSFLLIGLLVLLGLALLYVRSKRPAPEDQRAPTGWAVRRALLESEAERVFADISNGRQLVSANGEFALGLSADTQQILVLAAHYPEKSDARPTFRKRVLTGRDLLGAELREQLVVHGEGGNAETKVRALDLLLFVDDLEQPVCALPLLAEAVKCGSRRWRDAVGEGNWWQGAVRVLAARASSSGGSTSRTASAEDARREAALARAADLMSRARG